MLGSPRWQPSDAAGCQLYPPTEERRLEDFATQTIKKTHDIVSVSLCQ
jgi:hypothetical protein